LPTLEDRDMGGPKILVAENVMESLDPQGKGQESKMEVTHISGGNPKNPGRKPYLEKKEKRKRGQGGLIPVHARGNVRTGDPLKLTKSEKRWAGRKSTPMREWYWIVAGNRKGECIFRGHEGQSGDRLRSSGGHGNAMLIWKPVATAGYSEAHWSPTL